MKLSEQAEREKRLAEMKFYLKFPIQDADLRPFLEAIYELYEEHTHMELHKIIKGLPNPLKGRTLV